MDPYAGAADQIDLTVRDVRALARAARPVVQPEAEDPVRERLPAAIRGLARVTEALAAYLQTFGEPADETRRLAPEAAREASTLLEKHEGLASNLGANPPVDQIHSSAVDLIGGTGMTVRRPCKPWKRPPDVRRGRARYGRSGRRERIPEVGDCPGVRP